MSDLVWQNIIRENAQTLARAVETRFDSRMRVTISKVLGMEMLDEQAVVFRTGEVINKMFDMMVGTTVNVIIRHANSSKDIEERVVSKVRYWFEAIRDLEGSKSVDH